MLTFFVYEISAWLTFYQGKKIHQDPCLYFSPTDGAA